MTIERWCSFALASFFILASPGPVAALAVASALTRGRAACVVVAGAGLGDFIALSVSLSSIGAVIVRAPTAASALKAAGAAVLIGLGVRMIVTGGRKRHAPMTIPVQSRLALFWTAFAITALHPGGLVFYISYVPQFVDSSRSLVPQLALMQATFLVLGLTTTALWVYVGSRTGTAIGGSRWLNRIGGGFLLLLGASTIVMILSRLL